jgi:CRP-like cAMP-binding protein
MEEEDFDFTKPAAPPSAPKPAAPQPAPAPATAPSAPFKPAQSRFYDAAVAERIFRSAGKAERFAANQVLFAEQDKAGGLFRGAARMYFVVEGEVNLSHGGKPLDVVEAGEVFGEMAVVSERPRSATATAKTAGSAFSLDRSELQGALAKEPEFALMLMSVMFDRLRFLAALAARRRNVASAVRESTVFDADTLERFEQALPRAGVVRHWAEASIMREGQAGAFMYVVKSGRVTISIRGTPVEVVLPGGTFGEMALVDQSPRTASAAAQTECELLQVDRPALLAAVSAQPAFGLVMLRAVAERLRHMNAQLN